MHIHLHIGMHGKCVNHSATYPHVLMYIHKIYSCQKAYLHVSNLCTWNQLEMPHTVFFCQLGQFKTQYGSRYGRERERESDGQMVTIVFPENPMQRFFIARVQLCINLGDMNLLSSALLQGFETITLQETNISPKNGILKMIFLFPRWDMLIPWRVYFAQIDAISSPWDHGQFMPPGSTWTYKYGNDTVARQWHSCSGNLAICRCVWGRPGDHQMFNINI